jgi:hypothetical protein
VRRNSDIPVLSKLKKALGTPPVVNGQSRVPKPPAIIKGYKDITIHHYKRVISLNSIPQTNISIFYFIGQ